MLYACTSLQNNFCTLHRGIEWLIITCNWLIICSHCSWSSLSTACCTTVTQGWNLSYFPGISFPRQLSSPFHEQKSKLVSYMVYGMVWYGMVVGVSVSDPQPILRGLVSLEAWNEWVSSCLTAHQHNIGHSVPFGSLEGQRTLWSWERCMLHRRFPGRTLVENKFDATYAITKHSGERIIQLFHAKPMFHI